MSDRQSRQQAGNPPQRASAARVTASDVSEPMVDRLPRGRHRLSREQVEQSQRHRMLLAMADAMAEKGYVGTSVADVLKRSGVGRETFYQHYRSKLDCFLEAFDIAGSVLLARMEQVRRSTDAPPLERFEHAFSAYLEVLTEQPSLARVFLVEVYAAGPEAMARRTGLQARLVDGMTELLDASTDRARFACEVLVAAISTLVTTALVNGDHEALARLKEPVVDLVREAMLRRPAE